jgi:hypothetical protein
MHLESYFCVLYQDQVEENVHHLFLGCSFVQNCWNLINISLLPNSSFPEAVLQMKELSHPRFFMPMAILVCWAIWKVRYDFIFNNQQQSLSAAKETFRK